MAGEKTYLKCSAKAHTFNNGDQIIKLSFKDTDIAAFVREHKNERGYVNLIISQRREVGQYGDTHSVSLDTWQPPKPSGQPTHYEQKRTAPVTSDDIPFAFLLPFLLPALAAFTVLS